jgi:glycosyltransferase involved in cell wall biosynthesis
MIKNKRIQVLHYIPGFKSGGIESRLLDWYRNIDREKIQFSLVKLNEIDNSHNTVEFKQLGGIIHNLPKLNIINFFLYFKFLVKLLKKNKYDIVHVHNLHSGLFVLFASKMFGIKCRVLHSRTTDYLPSEKYKPFKKILMKLSPMFATHFFSCSMEAAKWGFGKKIALKSKIIKNGIQLKKFNFDSATREKIRKELNIKNEFIIGTICRLSPQKNLIFLINLFEKIFREDKNIILTIVGAGSSQKEIEKVIEDFKLNNKVVLCGEKSNVHEYYMAFDMFIATSLYEGFGTTAIEAQATGLPSIVSTGFPETVCVTNLIQRIDLEESLEIWKKKALETIQKTRNPESIAEVKNAGYDASMVAKELEFFYTTNI